MGKQIELKGRLQSMVTGGNLDFGRLILITEDGCCVDIMETISRKDLFSCTIKITIVEEE